MRKRNSVPVAILILPALALAALSSAPVSSVAATKAAAAPVAKEADIDPQALDALKRMSDFYGSLSEFGLHEEITREQVINGDLKVQKNSTAEVLARRPDHLKAVVVADDDKSHAFYFDGKTFTLYMPAKNYFAQADLPGTTIAALDTVESRYGVEFPTPDFLHMASGEDFTHGLSAAGFVGKSHVGDTECDHYAYRSADVDYQVWIANGQPLPLKLVVTSKKIPAAPEYTAVMTWDLKPKIDDASFVFSPPQGATKIPFGSPPAAGKKAQPQPQKK
jgi:hypothetical protein